MQWTLCLYPQSRRDPSDPAAALSFEKRLQEIIAIFDTAVALASDKPQIKHADRLLERLLQSISSQLSLVGQPSTRQLTRFWFLYGEIKLALGDMQSAADALECCAGLVAHNPAHDHIAVNFLRARVAGEMRLFSKSKQHYTAIIAHLDHLQSHDFTIGDLRSFRCFVHLQRAKHHLSLGDFAEAQDDMQVATGILDRALMMCGAPRPRDADHEDNRAMHPAFVGYAERLRALAARGEPVTDGVMRNWLELCLDVPATYAAVEMWHTRLHAQERGANGLLAGFYDLLIACGKISALLPLWSEKTTLLYYRAAEVAIIGHDVTYLLQHHAAAPAQDEAKRAWLRRADQALAIAFSERDEDDDAPTHDADLRLQVTRHGVWLRQQNGHSDDFPAVPDLSEIGSGVNALLRLASAQGKTWGAAICTQLLGYIALARGDRSDADGRLHDALTLFAQAPGDIFYPRYEETRRAVACLSG